MNTDNYNKALGMLAFYRRMAVIAEKGTPRHNTYVDKLAVGISILAIAYDKCFDEVDLDVCEAYDSKYASSGM